ncbi:CBS domain-containing protein [Candidatus Woesearchaeota archaeon]|nr:CBS domain-containing protein [Candidatus Woesearchaeota archaeon]
MLQLKDWMTDKVITCSKSDTVLKAARKMADHSIGSLVVVNAAKKPVGIVTETDILRKVVAEDDSPAEVTVDQIMSDKIITVDINTSILQLSQKMQEHHLRRIPITKNNKLVGIITSRDLVRIMSGC